MSISEKVLQLKTDLDEVYQAGVKSEYDRFWDAFQQNGKKQSYAYSFVDWYDEAFTPKYDIVPNSGGMTQCFYSTKITNLKALLEKQGVKLDTSNVTDMTGMFNMCNSLSLLKLDNFTITESKI